MHEEQTVNAPERPLQPQLDQFAAEPFNEYDDAQMHDIVGNERLRKPIQALLEQLCAHDATTGSFGVDWEKAYSQMVTKVRELRQACKDEWLDIR